VAVAAGGSAGGVVILLVAAVAALLWMRRRRRRRRQQRPAAADDLPRCAMDEDDMAAGSSLPCSPPDASQSGATVGFFSPFSSSFSSGNRSNGASSARRHSLHAIRLSVLPASDAEQQAASSAASAASLHRRHPSVPQPPSAQLLAAGSGHVRNRSAQEIAFVPPPPFVAAASSNLRRRSLSVLTHEYRTPVTFAPIMPARERSLSDAAAAAARASAAALALASPVSATVQQRGFSAADAVSPSCGGLNSPAMAAISLFRSPLSAAAVSDRDPRSLVGSPSNLPLLRHHSHDSSVPSSRAPSVAAGALHTLPPPPRRS